LFVQIYIGLARPRELRIINNIEFVNEALIYVSTIHMMFFTDFIPDKDLEYTLGFSMVATSCGIIAICLPFVLYYGSRSIFLICLKYGRIIMKKIRNLNPKPTLKVISEIA
jgi:hypothetical protein